MKKRRLASRLFKLQANINECKLRLFSFGDMLVGISAKNKKSRMQRPRGIKYENYHRNTGKPFTAVARSLHEFLRRSPG
jgi:hypothetical protein